MISIRVEENYLRINCSRKEKIGVLKLKRMFRLGKRLMEKNGNLPVIVDAERSLNLNSNAQELFNRLNKKCEELTLVIISG